MAQLREYQKIAVSKLVDNPRFALWADMGMGKSAITSTALRALSLLEPEAFPALIVAPKRVVEISWPVQLEKWAPEFKYEILAGNAAVRREKAAKTADIYLVSYDLLSWAVDYVKPNTLVLDEASKVRGFRGGYKLYRGKPYYFAAGPRRAKAAATFSLYAKRVIELTGTPTPNGLQNLWGQIWMLDHGARLGRTYSEYLARWFKPTVYLYGRPVQYAPLAKASKEIAEAVQDITFTLHAEDWLPIDKPVFTKVEVQLPTAARTLYEQIKDDLYAKVERGVIAPPNSGAAVGKLLQVASGAVYIDDETWTEVHTAKLDALEDLIDELQGAPVLISYWWRHDLERLQKRFPEAVRLDTPSGFQAFISGKAQLGLANPASLGHGVDGLQHQCHNVVFFSSWWDAELRWQLIERVGPVRQVQAGYNRAVHVYDIVASDTVDMTLLDLIAGKADVQKALFELLKYKSLA